MTKTSVLIKCEEQREVNSPRGVVQRGGAASDAAWQGVTGSGLGLKLRQV